MAKSCYPVHIFKHLAAAKELKIKHFSSFLWDLGASLQQRKETMGKSTELTVEEVFGMP
jgi:hypothetical protein